MKLSCFYLFILFFMYIHKLKSINHIFQKLTNFKFLIIQVKKYLVVNVSLMPFEIEKIKSPRNCLNQTIYYFCS